MKKIILLSLLVLASCSNKKEIKQVAEVSCGQCKFEIEEPKGCDLAIRIDDKAYFIDGANIDDFGDAHDKTTGFCNVIRKADVVGTIENGRFKATSIKILE
ncbi:MAG: DUF6370 family protein [Polaribacter sp.]|uniref:DUF6370 family protein n=1 Tax=Polaribacter sp. TaxID=1920175 RepID=UPI002F35199A